MDSAINKKIMHTTDKRTSDETSGNEDCGVYFDTHSDFDLIGSKEFHQVEEELSLHLKEKLNILADSSSDKEYKAFEKYSQTAENFTYCGSSNNDDDDEDKVYEKQCLDSSCSLINNSQPLKFSEELEFIPPCDELAEKIMIEVEKSFSDFNFFKDDLLKKHIRWSKDGYISIKLVASFKKVRALTRDWRAVQYSLQKSTTLTLNEQGNRVRRIVPIPNFKDSVYARIVLMLNIPPGKISPENVRQLMSSLGVMTKVMVIHPGEDIPAICTKRCLSICKLFVDDKAFAIVEFQTYESAAKAISTHRNLNNDHTLLKVIPLMPDAYKWQSKPQSSKKPTQSSNANPKVCRSDESKKKSNSASKGGNSSRKKQVKSEKVQRSEPEIYNRINSEFTTHFDINSTHMNLQDIDEKKPCSPSHSVRERKKYHSSPQFPPSRLPKPFIYSDRNYINSIFEKRAANPVMISYPYASAIAAPSMVPRLRYSKSKSLTPSVPRERFIPVYPFSYYSSLIRFNQRHEMGPFFHYKNSMHHFYPKSSSSPGYDSHLPSNIIRWPRGPDGTAGFHDQSRRLRVTLNN